jgi:hypothetical protein
MSDAVRMQFDSEGNIVDTSLETAMKQEATAPAPAPKQTGAFRGRFDESTGQFVVEQNRATEYRFTPAEKTAVTVRSNAGPITLAQAGPDSIADFPGFGETSCAAAVTMGLLVPRNGGGYEAVQSASAAPATQQQQQPQQKKADESPAGDPTGIEPTSAQTDQTLSAIESKSPAALEGLVTSLSQTGEVSPAIIADMARTHGVEPAQMQAQVDAIVADHTRAARQAIARVDSSIDPDSFTAWLLKSPELADRVTRDVMGKSVREVQNAAREYVNKRDGAIESALVGKGIETTRIEGKLYMSRKALGLAPKPRMGDFPASDWIAVDEAVRAGHLTING